MEYKATEKGFNLCCNGVNFEFSETKKFAKNGIFYETSVLGNAPVPKIQKGDRILLPMGEGIAVTSGVFSNCEKEMADEIFKVKMDNDSIGGIIQTAICNLPVGLGEPWFDSFEGIISNALFSIGGIKGVEFGAGFGFADLTGSNANDAFTYKMGKVVTKTNNSGGINGGITNGMPVIFNAAVKPTPSISKPQETIDFINGTNTSLEIVGRHDPAIIRRICIVVTSLIAVVVCDVLSQTYGKDYLQ